jgi:hypothetical protein
MDGPQRQLVVEIFQSLAGTLLEGQLVLAGSSGLFAFPTRTPAFTEDLDFLISEELVAARGEEIVALLGRSGYQRVPGTPTFTAPGRPTFDLIGYSRTDPSDHLSPPGFLQVMVFGDLGTVLAEPGSVDHHPDGMVALSPAAFCAVKLLTLRSEKGSKDKLQGLLVVAERAAEAAFRSDLVRLLRRFDLSRREDALADAQLAFLSLQRDPFFRNHGAEGYRDLVERAEAGYRELCSILAEDLREGAHG